MNDIPLLPDGIPVFTRPELLEEVAAWLERRLDETVGWRSGSRLYGLTLLDPDALGRDEAGAMRITYLGEGYVYPLLGGPAGQAATGFDALGLCCFGVATNLETGRRRRCRTVLVANCSGQSTVNRLKGERPECLGRPHGPVADLVGELFAQDREPPAHVA